MRGHKRVHLHPRISGVRKVLHADLNFLVQLLNLDLELINLTLVHLPNLVLVFLRFLDGLNHVQFAFLPALCVALVLHKLTLQALVIK